MLWESNVNSEQLKWKFDKDYPCINPELTIQVCACRTILLYWVCECLPQTLKQTKQKEKQKSEYSVYETASV